MLIKASNALVYLTLLAGIILGFMVTDHSWTPALWYGSYLLSVNFRYLNRALIIRSQKMPAIDPAQLGANVWDVFNGIESRNINVPPSISIAELRTALEIAAPEVWRDYWRIARIPWVYTLMSRMVLPGFRYVQFGRLENVKPITPYLDTLDLLVLVAAVGMRFPAGVGYDFWLRADSSTSFLWGSVGVAVIIGMRVAYWWVSKEQSAGFPDAGMAIQYTVAPFVEETVHGWAYVALLFWLFQTLGMPGIWLPLALAALIAGAYFSYRHSRWSFASGVGFFTIHLILTILRVMLGVPIAVAAHLGYNVFDLVISTVSAPER